MLFYTQANPQNSSVHYPEKTISAEEEYQTLGRVQGTHRESLQWQTIYYYIHLTRSLERHLKSYMYAYTATRQFYYVYIA